jgi:HEAT repeat protein
MALRTTKLIQILQTGDEKAKVDAAYTLGERKARQAEDALLTALNEESLEVKEWAAEALGKLKSTRAIEPLIGLLIIDDFEIRTQVGWSLNEIGPDGLKALYKELSNKNSDIRTGATTALGNLRAKWAIEGIIALLKDEKAEVRAAGGDALERIGDKSAIEPLIPLLSDNVAIVRATAMSALAGLGAREVTPRIIIALTKDADWFVRNSAARALLHLGVTEAIEPLMQSLQDENEHVREMAKIALVKLKRVDILGLESKNL